MNDLRSELLSGVNVVVPAYRMLIPPGWEAFDLGPDTERELIHRATARIPSDAQAPLRASLAQHVKEALTALRGQRAFAYALPLEGAPTWALGAASLVGTKRLATPEAPLDRIVQNAITRHGGVPIGEGHRIVRWTERRPVTLDDVSAVSLLITYLIPIPGSRLTEAVQWTATVTHDESMPADDPLLLAWIELFDFHVATFTWSAR